MARRTGALIALAVCVLVSGIALAACGGGSSTGGSETSASSEGGSSSVSSADLARYERELEEAYEGTYTPPQGEPFKPPSGKNIWVVSVGQQSEGTAETAEIISEVGPKLGWKVTVFDGKFEPNRWQEGIEQAIAAKADGIALLYIDCAPVKSALEQAKKAGIPVVATENKDCNPSLLTNITFSNGETFLEKNEKAWGKFQADYVIGKTKGETKVITTEETDLETTKAMAAGAKKQLEACPTCEIVEEIKFVGTELGPPLQQKIEQALNQNPEANAFIGNYDTVLTSGGAAALRASGRLGEIAVVGGEGTAEGLELIWDESGSDACVGYDQAWTGYALIDLLGRSFAGKSLQGVDSGLGVQLCDKEHNLPPKGTSFVAPIKYVPLYEKMWGLK